MLNTFLSVTCFLSFTAVIVTLFVWFKVKRNKTSDKKSLSKKQRILLIMMLSFLTLTILTFTLYTYLVAQ